MRILTFLLLMLLGTTMLGLAALKDPGYVYISHGRWSAESSLFVLLLFWLLLYLVFYVVVRTLSGFFSIPSIWQHWHNRTLNRRACQLTQKGLIALAEGHWKEAEQDLIRLADHSDTPLINYLGAARAAQKLGHGEQRDQYLAEAYLSTPDAKLAVGLTQADIQLSAGEYESALATLRELHHSAPKHGHVLYLLHKLYIRLQSWDDLRLLLPELRRQQVLEEARLLTLEQQLHIEGLRHAADSGDEDGLRKAWAAIPKTLHTKPEVLAIFVSRLMALGHHTEAEKRLHAALAESLSPPLLELYGHLELAPATQPLAHAEEWLKQNPHHPELLLVCARLAARAKLWGKARSFFEASLSRHPLPRTHCELAQLLETMGESEAAIQVYKSGLQFAASQLGCKVPA